MSAKRKRIRLRPSEQRIWEAAYAAAYVRAVHDTIPIVGYDRAIAAGHGERAEDVAHEAVRELRRWRREGSWPKDMTLGAPKVIDEREESHEE